MAVAPKPHFICFLFSSNLSFLNAVLLLLLRYLAVIRLDYAGFLRQVVRQVSRSFHRHEGSGRAYRRSRQGSRGDDRNRKYSNVNRDVFLTVLLMITCTRTSLNILRSILALYRAFGDALNWERGESVLPCPWKVGGVYSLVACFSRMAVDHAFLARPGDTILSLAFGNETGDGR